MMRPEEEFNEALRLDANLAGVYFVRGKYHWKLQRYEEALADHNKSIALDPNVPSAYLDRALVLEVLDRHKEALADYDKAIQLEPGDDTGYVNRGVVFQKYWAAGRSCRRLVEGDLLNP